MSGFIKIQRKFFDHPLWQEDRKFSRAEAWIDLIRSAAFKPTQRIVRGKFIELDEGELIASLRFLAKRWRWKKDAVSSFLTSLESQTMTRRETRQGETVITLCNYKSYGGGVVETQTETRQESRQKPDKVEEVKEEKNNRVEPSQEGFQFSNWFESLRPSHMKTTPAEKRKWAEDYDKLKRLDGKSKDQIKAVCKWARKDDFWQTNFLSPLKLRKKNKDGVKYFDVFETNMKTKTETPKPKQSTAELNGF